MTDGLGGRAARGVAVTLVAQVLRIVIQLLSVVVLSRLLLPSDYGLVAMVMAVIGVGEIFRDFGLSSAAIQAPTLSVLQRDKLFWVNSGIGLVLSVAAFLSAPLVALVFDEDALVAVTHALAVTFLLNGLSTQYRASLIRELQFKKAAAVDVSAAMLGFLAAVIAALSGMGLWALVLQQLVTGAVGLAGLVVAGSWLPGLPDRATSIAPFIRFGLPLIGSQLIGYAANNVDTWTVGMRFGPAALGYYNRAYQLLMTPLNQVRSPSTTVALPVLTRVSSDQNRFASYLTMGQLAMGLPVTVVLALIIGTADEIVQVFLGADWARSAPFLQLFAVAALFQTLSFVGYWVYLARGLTAVLLRYSMVSAAIKISAVLIGAQWGAIGVAVGFAVAPAVSWPISLWWLSRSTPVPQRDLYANALRIVLQAVPVAAVAFAVTALSLPPAVELLLAALGGGLVFGLVALMVPAFRRDLRDLWTVVKMVRGRGQR